MRLPWEAGTGAQMATTFQQQGHPRVSSRERGLVDLTMPISEHTIPVPDHPAPEAEPLHEIENDGLRYTVMRLSLHTGTHIDAPSHLVADGATIDQIPIERFWRPGLRVDLRDARPGEPIEVDSLVRGGFEPADTTDTILLLASGWTDRAWQSQALHEDGPFLSEAAANAIAEAGPAALGLDFAVDRRKPWSNHKTLLRAGVPLIENLMGLRALPPDDFEVIAFPLRLAGESGAPVRVVASIPQRGPAEHEHEPAGGHDRG